MKTAENFREFCGINSINLSKDKDGQVGYQTKTVHSEYTHKDETYHILSGCNEDGKVLFIPSIGAWNAAENREMKLGELTVVEGGTAKDGVTPVFFLHKPASFAGTVNSDMLGF